MTLKSFIFLFLLSCVSVDLFQIDYTDEDLSDTHVFGGSQRLLKEKRFKDVDTAYHWLKKNAPKFYDDSVFVKHIELYGLQERFEKQLDFYSEVFTSDTLNRARYVPHFYHQIGLSFLKRSHILVENQLDSSLVIKAIDYFKRASTYELYVDSNLNAAAQYYQGLSQIRLGKDNIAKQLFEQLLLWNLETDYKIKAFFKQLDLSSDKDFELSPTQRNQFKLYQDSLKLKHDSLSLNSTTNLQE